MKKFLLSFIALLCAIVSNAQIGYQVSLLNTATGEPRSCETVSCVIELTDSEGTVICSETKTATSNDFGVISLTVGNANTFDNMDWSKLPLYIAVTVDGKLVGQSQVLTVPLAECAKQLAPNPEIIGKWHSYMDYFTLGTDGKFSYIQRFWAPGHFPDYIEELVEHSYNGEYFVQGNTVHLIGGGISEYDEIGFHQFLVYINGYFIEGNGSDVFTKQQ